MMMFIVISYIYLVFLLWHYYHIFSKIKKNIYLYEFSHIITYINAIILPLLLYINNKSKTYLFLYLICIPFITYIEAYSYLICKHSRVARQNPQNDSK